MTADLPTIITALTGLLSGLAAVLSAVAAVYAVWAKQDVAVVKDDVLKIEKATNSMKDALVKATGDAQFLEGEKQGRRNEENRAAGQNAPDPKDAVTINADVAEITVEKVVTKK